MKLTALSIALIAALGMTSGCSTQGSKQSLTATPMTVDAEAQYALGRYYQGQQRYELAIEAYRKALSANPAHVSAHNGLGASLLLVGQNTQAIEQFKTGLVHQPRSAALWNNLGYAYMLTGESKLAEIALRQALDLDPADTKTSTNLAAAQERPIQPLATEPATPVLASAVPEQTSAPARTESTPVQAQAAPAKVKAAPSVAAVPGLDRVLPAPGAMAATEQPAAVVVQAPASVQVVEIAPRVYELNMPETTVAGTQVAFTSLVILPVKATGTTIISVPLRGEGVGTATTVAVKAGNTQQEKAQLASINNEDFILEIRNGNGVRRMALRTSQYLAHQGYTTKRLTNQPGFNVATTRVFYLPGYLAEAERLLAHLPRNATMSESFDLRQGTHVRVVLGRDMVQLQAGLDKEIAPIHLAALTR